MERTHGEGQRWAVPHYFLLVPVPSVLWKKSTGTAVPVLIFFHFEKVHNAFAKSSIIKKHTKKVKSAQLHLLQQSLDIFLF